MPLGWNAVRLTLVTPLAWVRAGQAALPWIDWVRQFRGADMVRA